MSVRVEVENIFETRSQLVYFRSFTTVKGVLWRLNASTVLPHGLGFAMIDAMHWVDDKVACFVTIATGDRIVKIRIYGLSLNLEHHATFARQFNTSVLPRVIDKARELGLIGGGSCS